MDSRIKADSQPEVNPAVSAMQMLQNVMRGEAEKAGIRSEQDAVDLVKSVRAGEKPGLRRTD